MENTFGINIIPDNDEQRIAALRRYQILDTPPEGAFDNVARLATQIFKVPISLVSLVDAEQVYFKANIGMGQAKVTSRGVSLCSLAVLKQEVTVFENAPEEPCLLVNPNVAGSFGLKFYAGAPLTTYDGFRIGTLCVIDKTPRPFTKDDEAILEGLAKIVMDEIELRLSAIEEKTTSQGLIEESAALNEELLTSNEQLESVHATLNENFEALTINEAKLKYMIADAPVAIGVLTGKELIIETANDKIIELWGKDNEIVGKPLHIALPELEGQPFLQILDNVLTSGQPFHGNDFKAQLVRNGKLSNIYFDFVYHPLKDASGQATAIMVVASDVTEQVNNRKEIEDLNQQLIATNEEIVATNEELRSANDELKQMQEDLLVANAMLADSEELKAIAIEQAKLGIWYIDAVTREFLPSARLKEFFGYGPDEDMPYDAAVNQIREDYRERVAREVDEAISNGKPYDLEYPIIDFRDKRLRWVRATGKLNPAENGRQSYFSGTIMDITEQKEDDQRKNDFISMVSHELKTPLTSMNGYVQMLQMVANKSEDNFAAGVLGKANLQIRKMTAMIDGFLNMKRLETGKIPLNKQFFDMADLVRETEEESISTISSHKVIFAPVEPTPIEADRDKIGQVINNLISNAVKYSPTGSVINVACISIDKCVQVSVKDQGMGISPEDQHKLFDRFYRVESSAMTNINGFGIGLYLCDEIIERHGGKIWVDSAIGKGATFYFNLPIL